jgi:hypothetical protein
MRRRQGNPTVTAVARPRSNCTSKLRTHPLVREGALIKKLAGVRQKENNLVIGSGWEPDTKIDWLTDRRP